MNPPKVGRCFLRLNISPYQPLLAGYRRGKPAAEPAYKSLCRSIKNHLTGLLAGSSKYTMPPASMASIKLGGQALPFVFSCSS
jgi:hypothetical protein